jgi:PadR family transcriptional regulator PadR
MAALEPRNFLQPCLLLLLRERPDHGYELAARLRPMHEGDGDAGAVYRTLRGLERLGLVRSEWQTSDVGPARRTYFITQEGLVSLDGHAGDLEQIHEALHVFLDRYLRVVAADGREGSGDVRGSNGRARGVRTARHPHRSAGS